MSLLFWLDLFRWLFSRTFRKAGELGDTVQKILDHQRDVLPGANIATVEAALAALKKVVRSGADAAAIKAQMASLEEEANRWLRPYPNADFREYAVMFLEIAILILGSRAFLVQPMVIPTGSAQPTLWGITYEDLRDKPEVVIPSGPMRLWDRWVNGISYYHVVAEQDLELIDADRQPKTLVPFVSRQSLKTTAGDVTIWFPPDSFPQQLGLLDDSLRFKKTSFRKGEDIVRARVTTGDHLFVERVTYNFRRPKRGEIIVFRSETHPGMTANTHYIKRLVGLGGERIRIGDDRHTYINGVPLTTNDHGFEKVFAFDPQRPPIRINQPDQHTYSGHLNGTVWYRAEGNAGATRNFPDEKTEYTIRPGHYVCFGDNTMNSADSRHWGEPDFDQKKVIGRSLFVFWPFTRRFGPALH